MFFSVFVCFLLHSFTNRPIVSSFLHYNLRYDEIGITGTLIQARFLWVHKSERAGGQNGAGRSMGAVSCKDREVTGQIWCAWVLMCECVCAFEDGKRENKKERKREREVWYHQLNNPPTQHLVLSLRPSVLFPTVVRWFFCLFHVFFPPSLPVVCWHQSVCFSAWTCLLARVTEWSFTPSARTEHSIFHPP